ncbi:PLD nuclease N-terminal domain-containing protein [Arthrobacter sp. L77]|uniref:PLD nuclease N-terminal domain-containing protein n=1 Tax=Arthrobacter sp. L77 TaxID=1496689 RepID=UPI00068E168E|nr:PLD nuclease N-terminal domain-containing protein [Arthrobacter sp. L77]
MADRKASTHHSKKAARKRWSDLTDGQKARVLVLGALQLSLAAFAWMDLATRPRDTVNGSKGMWALIIAINFVGPVAYFWKGIRR